MAEGGGGGKPPEEAGQPQDLQHALQAEFEAAQAEIAAILEGERTAEELEELPSSEELAAQDLRQDIGLKGTYARILLMLLAGQLVVADAVFIVYAWAGRSWDLPSSVIEVWLGATLVEIVGIVLVVTRYLFPRRDTQP